MCVELCISTVCIYEALNQVKTTLTIENELMAALKKIKASTNGLKVFAMSNIVKDDLPTFPQS